MGHDGRPVEVLTPETIALIEEEVLSDRRLKVREIAARLRLSKTSVHRAIQDHLHMSKVSARWVPRLLSAVQREERERCASEFLKLCGEEPNKIFEKIVTGDETMVLYYDPESKGSQYNGVLRGKSRQRRQRCNSQRKRSCQPFSGIAMGS